MDPTIVAIVLSALAGGLVASFAREDVYLRGMGDGEHGLKLGASFNPWNTSYWIFARRYVAGYKYGALTRELRAKGLMKR